MAAKETQTGLKKETAAALSYVLGPITGVIFLIMEKDPFVRFHSMQSIVFSVAVLIINTLLTVTVVLALLLPVLFLLEFALWLMLIYKASQGVEWELPILGTYTKKFLK